MSIKQKALGIVSVILTTIAMAVFVSVARVEADGPCHCGGDPPKYVHGECIECANNKEQIQQCRFGTMQACEDTCGTAGPCIEG